MPPRKSQDRSIGDVLRRRRTEELKKGLREMARLLDITAPHLTDIEKGRRTPSEDLIMRISKEYDFPEADLRAGWSRPETIVGEIAAQDPLTAEKVPELLRTARRLSSKQWDSLIEQARRMSGRKDNRSDK